MTKSRSPDRTNHARTLWLIAGCVGAIVLVPLLTLLSGLVWIIGFQIPITIATTVATMLVVSFIAKDDTRRNTALGAAAVVATLGLTGTRSIIRRLRRQPDEAGAQVYYDPLTNLPNRALLFDHIELALPRAHRANRAIAVLFVDLDDFKEINDKHGHAAGDTLLIAVASVLQATLRGSDTAARLGGDEFVVLLDDVAGPREATLVAERILNTLEHPFRYGEQEIPVKASIGIALSESSDDRPAELLERADAAMYRAKRSPLNHYQIYDKRLNDELRRRRLLERDLRDALKHNQLRVLFQPTVRLQTNSIVGAEALVRWYRPDYGLLSPEAFVPVAEESGLITAIDRWVLRQACERATTWLQHRTANHAPLISVNLSPRQLLQPTLVAEVAAVLDETGLDPELLMIEIPERVLQENDERVVASIQALKRLGVVIAVDQFGAGASSLQTLYRSGIDYVKIDRAYMADLGKNPETTSLVSALITLAHSLGLRVFAQGVETGHQAAWLRDLGCDLAQGFYFARPDSHAGVTSLFHHTDPPISTTAKAS